jgi:hypothetical protein
MCQGLWAGGAGAGESSLASSDSSSGSAGVVWVETGAEVDSGVLSAGTEDTRADNDDEAGGAEPEVLEVMEAEVSDDVFADAFFLALFLAAPPFSFSTRPSTLRFLRVRRLSSSSTSVSESDSSESDAPRAESESESSESAPPPIVYLAPARSEALLASVEVMGSAQERQSSGAVSDIVSH